MYVVLRYCIVVKHVISHVVMAVLMSSKYWTIVSVSRESDFLWTSSMSLRILFFFSPESLTSWKRKFWMLQGLLISSVIKTLQVLRLLPSSLQVSQESMSQNLIQRTLGSLLRSNASVVLRWLIRLDVGQLSPVVSVIQENLNL